MSRGFHFAGGNARKLAGLPWYAVGAALAAVVPRDPRRWVVGSAFGPADGALAVHRATRELAPEVGLTWLAASPSEARACAAQGIRTVPRASWRGWWRTQRAGVAVVTHGFGDVSRYAVTGARVVQLWHGTPLKKLHLDSPAALRLPVLGGRGPARAVMGAMYRRGTSRIAVLPASSPTAAARLASAFGLAPDRVPVLGEPRTDVVFTGTVEARVDAARERLASHLGELPAGPVILHAPTWRDGAADPVVPTAREWAAIEDFLEARDGLLVVRPHPLGAGGYAHPSPRVRLLESAVEPEVNALLWAVDAVVTDYSSILVDYAPTGRPVVVLAPDHAAYERSRGMYEPVASIAGGHVESTWAQALDRLGAVLSDGPDRVAAQAHSAALAERYHAHSDGRSAERVVRHVLGLLGHPAGAAAPAVPLAHGGAGDIVWFESFYGRTASCNPLAIDREVARRQPGLRRVWSVVDDDVDLPPGAEGVVVGSAQWHATRDAARLLVVNDWIRDGWRPRRGQHVLQTWHGTPLKRLALGRRRRSPREVAAVVRQSTRWSAMLAQNTSAATVLRRAYAVRAPMWTLGYPRNDDIASGRCPEVRERLGITAARIVLYAPTWRDGDLAAPHLLDVSALADALGPDWAVVVRGHARTMRERPESGGASVVDATRYPDATPLLAAADVLVTDYSSVMFDFSAGGRPMVFFVPDLADYAGERGLYWDLAARAPGPLVTTVEDCAAAVLGARQAAPHWAARYAAWRSEFNPLDDGRAAARVVARLQREGWLPPERPRTR